MGLKRYTSTDVLAAAKERIRYVFDKFERIYVSFSGGKDSTTMLHLVAEEAARRGRRVGVLVIDLEAQYRLTIDHIAEMLDRYREQVDAYWVCLPMLLRNAVSQFEPRWCCWEPGAPWVRQPPNGAITDPAFFEFFQPRMEFEEFMVLFGVWYGQGAPACAFVGIRADESLNRFRTIASRTKETHGGRQFTTRVEGELYNAYPLYDWKTEDIWRYHARNPELGYNRIYDRMHQAGVPLGNMRLCQPYGDDQRRGLWLFSVVEPQTWAAVVARVSGANSGALYVQETGNVTGYSRISKPDGHTWRSFCELLLRSLPAPTREHYLRRFRGFIKGWKGRGYATIPDEAPKVLEDKHWAPSYRRLCKVLLRNDWWCKGLGLTQPKSAAYGKYLELKKARA